MVAGMEGGYEKLINLILEAFEGKKKINKLLLDNFFFKETGLEFKEVLPKLNSYLYSSFGVFIKEDDYYYVIERNKGSLRTKKIKKLKHNKDFILDY
jgi:hypothetical protein